MIASNYLFVAVVSSSICVSSAFLVSNPQRPFLASSLRADRKLSKLAMTFDSAFHLTSPLIASASAAHSFTTADILTLSVEAELLNDAAHVLALDIVTAFFGRENLAVQLLSIVGRMFGMASDYIPDHTIQPEEFTFQMIMLGRSCKGLTKSLFSRWQAASHDTSLRDLQCYAKIFSRAGVSLMQYKVMSAVAAEWVDIEPLATIADSEDALYWLCSGTIGIQRSEDRVQLMSGKARHLLGDLHSLGADNKRITRLDMTLQAGPSGASVLRIDASKLKHIMDNDKSFAESIQSLLFQSMQAQVASLMMATK